MNSLRGRVSALCLTFADVMAGVRLLSIHQLVDGSNELSMFVEHDLGCDMGVFTHINLLAPFLASLYAWGVLTLSFTHFGTLGLRSTRMR